eukprot:310570_1
MQRTVSSEKIANNIDTKKENSMEFEYTFHVNNTFLHTICSQPTAQKLRIWLDSKMVIASVTSTAIIWMVLVLIFGPMSIISAMYWVIIACLFWIPWFILKHLLFNKNAYKLCITTFDYWIKICYGIIYAVSRLFYSNHLNVSVLNTIQWCLYVIFLVLVISYISSFDAFNMNKKKKLVLSIIASLLFSYFSFHFQFIEP